MCLVTFSLPVAQVISRKDNTLVKPLKCWVLKNYLSFWLVCTIFFLSIFGIFFLLFQIFCMQYDSEALLIEKCLFPTIVVPNGEHFPESRSMKKSDTSILYPAACLC